VARLKGGDPFVFGRGGEELEALRAAGIETHVVPGITAAAGCAASAGFPLTHRDIASSLTFVTGHGKDGEPTADWRALAASGSTLAIYMGLTHAGVIARSLTEAGMRADTPAAVIVNGTRENERVVTGTLSSLPMLAAREGGKGPALIVVGDIVRLAPAWSEANLLEAAS
jgi:uroporphyrin-III C-methyltransferase/precorrin-2 dehydrogenase/sirohydrochlorin ferrochelatase